MPTWLLEKWMLGFVISLGLTFPSTSVSRDAELLLPLSGTIEIGPDGRVRDYQIETRLKQAVAEAIDRNVRSWQFNPVHVNGKPVIAKSRMNLTLGADEIDDGYRLTIKDVNFGIATLDKKSMGKRGIRYPRQALRAGLGARVLLVVMIDEQGHVINIHPYQTSLSEDMEGQKASRWRAVFERASISAFRRAAFQPGEVIDGKQAGGTFVSPVEFRITSGPGRSRTEGDEQKWRVYYPGPITTAPWFRMNATLKQLESLEESDTFALNSNLHLRTDVIDRAL